MNLSRIEPKDVRIFGVAAFLFFGALAGIGFANHRLIFASVLSGLSLVGLGFIIIPAQLQPVYRLWLKAATFIGRIVTTVILSLAYYVIITPFGLMKRWLGGRPIPMKPNPDETTYWVSRSEPAQPKDRFLKRY